MEGRPWGLRAGPLCRYLGLMFILLASRLLLPVALAVPQDPAPDWAHTLDQVGRAVVSLRVDSPRSFDTVDAGSSIATGFVVDAERGLILTNHHVAGQGPIVAEAVFSDNEELPVRLIWRDPVHDFAFLQFNPSDLHFMEPVALALAPEAARVGMEIRVLGNDAGEKGSILPGTIARLDRPAPSYGRGNYNDFNTFYIQAASGTSGGSSGSPVVDAAGQVVALNAGSRRDSAASFFLPLDRVVRALRLLQEGAPIPRGSVGARIDFKTFDEVRRLGLLPSEEAALRAALPDASGLLVVDSVVPGADGEPGLLRPGDVLLAIQGAPLAGFLPLEEALDARVGGELTVRVARGAERLELALPVLDLEALSPHSYLEVSGAVISTVGAQLAHSWLVPVGRPVVASTGFALDRAGIPQGAMLLEVDGQPIPDLASLEAILAAKPVDARIRVRWAPLSRPGSVQVDLLELDRQWTPMRRCDFVPATGEWPCTDSAAAPPAEPWPVASTTALPSSDPRGRRLSPSMVEVHFDMPFRFSGVHGDRFRGIGLVVDATRGLVVVDRDTVPLDAGEVKLVFGGAVRVPGEVVWVHPLHNLAFISYDPSAIGDTPVRSIDLGSSAGLEAGDPIWQVGLTGRSQVVARTTRLARREPLVLPLPSRPFFRDRNLEVLVPEETTSSMGGALVDRKGRVQALWASFVDLSGSSPNSYFKGLPVELIAQALEAFRADPTAPWPDLGAELRVISLVEARGLGLEEEVARLLDTSHDAVRQSLDRVRGAIRADLAA